MGILKLSILFLFLHACGQVDSGDTDKTIDCIDGCSKPSPSPSPAANGCTITEIDGGSVITCGDKSVLIKDYDPDEKEETEPTLTESPGPTVSPGPNSIIIYQCKKGKHKND